MYHTSVNPNVRYGLRVIPMCQCRLITGDKCTTLVGNADSGGDYIYMWGMVYMINLCVPLNSEPKTTLINSVKKYKTYGPRLKCICKDE